MAPHPPFKQSAITPLPLPSSFIQFSSPENMFNPTKQHPESFISLSDHLRLSDGYDSCDDHAMAGGGTVYDESGICSPPLWKTTPRREMTIDYRCLSPSSRTQAIARGQRELMEMVSKMPESCYELTLKDLVEHRAVVDDQKQESFGSNSMENHKYKKERQNSQKQKIHRSGSLDNGGLLLKMVFPFSLGSKKKKKMVKKKNDCNISNNSEVSPKITVADVSDNDWWKNRSGSSESDGGVSTINSGNSSVFSSKTASFAAVKLKCLFFCSKCRHRMKGCLAFIFSRKTKASR
ncbi:putative Tetratricopeptide repeat (TPR)-like superfamily protein [Hibiscus syriacus]|uniref:Tetratricopeptide repeat (TPR)-like superfamily protein n=1 Tax=Hibiscus syriacus TaxID=106335 RepID=A0A6A2Z197_HIBSY|nr:uncharacterized protein LOC120152592 [Hibiscus syriacus]KAE8685681.1 putative Tetratricopeptide repeat (TPR)-like superfamily protein [Hibiscus syriacus]